MAAASRPGQAPLLPGARDRRLLVRRRLVKGDAALAAVASRWPDTAPRAALRALLERHEGNLVAAAAEIGLLRRVLYRAIAELPPAYGEEGELSWMASRWPARRRGGWSAHGRSWPAYRVVSPTDEQIIVEGRRAKAQARKLAADLATSHPGTEVAVYIGRGSPTQWEAAPHIVYRAT